MFNQFLEDLENATDGQLAKLKEELKTQAEPAKGFTPVLPNTIEARKQQTEREANTPPLSRADRRMLKRGGPPLIGNNRKNTDGRTIKQQEKMLMMTVGDEPRLVDVVTVVRGKGGKKKVVRRKTLLSRGIIATSPAEQKRLLGVIAPDEENDSIKNATIQVATYRTGRVQRA